MFRPKPEQTLFGSIPVRLIVSILLVFAIAISIVLVLGIEREKNLLAELSQEKASPGVFSLFYLKTQRDIVKVTVILFLLAAVGVSVLATYQSYHTTRQTLESVKSLTRNILGSIPTGVITVDSAGRITSINSAAEKVLSLKDEVLGRKLTELVPPSTGIGHLLDEALGGGASFRDQNVPFSKGDQDLVLWVTLSELKDDKGGREGLVLLVKDVSEITRLEQQLRRSEKLSAINTLSAAVAHEIRNPLSAMDLNLGLLEEEIRSQSGASETIQEYFDILNVEIKRLKGILDNFARFSKPTTLVFGEVRLEAILQHLVQLIRGEAHEKGVSLQLVSPPDLSSIPADENQLAQVFLNLMINALQAMPEGGALQVDVREKKSGNERWVEVRFSDTGVGIKKEKINKIFEPFFSTRTGGSGLGLAVAHRIIEDHGGTIHVESAEGKGSVFTVRLPVDRREEVIA